jgi:hypothetical protein
MCAEWIPAPLPPLPSPLLQPQFRAFLHLLVELSYSVSQCPLSPSCLPSVQYSSNSRNHVFKIRLGLINTLQVDTVFRIKSRLSQGKEGSPHSPLQLRLSLLIFLLTTLPPTHLLSVSPTGQVCLCQSLHLLCLLLRALSPIFEQPPLLIASLWPQVKCRLN